MKMKISFGKIDIANHTYTSEFTWGKLSPGVLSTGERYFLWSIFMATCKIIIFSSPEIEYTPWIRTTLGNCFVTLHQVSSPGSRDLAPSYLPSFGTCGEAYCIRDK